MTPEAQERMAQLAPLQQGLEAAWPTLKPHLEARKADLLKTLVSSNDEQVRGKIKQLDELLELPASLQQEAMMLSTAPQEEGELP